MYIIFVCAAFIFIYLGFFHKTTKNSSLEEFYNKIDDDYENVENKDNKLNTILRFRTRKHNLRVILSPKIVTKFVFFNIFFFIIVNFSMQVMGVYSYFMSLMITIFICSILILNIVKKERRSIFTDEFISFIQSLEMALSGGKDILTATIEISEGKDNYTNNVINKLCKNIQRGINIDKSIDLSIQDIPYIEFIFFTIVMKSTIINGNDAIPLVKRIYQLLISAKKLEGKINSMVSEPKGGAKVIGSVPVFFGLILYFLAPEAIEYIKSYYIGHIIYAYSVISILIGFFIVNKMIDMASEV